MSVLKSSSNLEANMTRDELLKKLMDLSRHIQFAGQKMDQDELIDFVTSELSEIGCEIDFHFKDTINTSKL
jgi:hypothetical protein